MTKAPIGNLIGHRGLPSMAPENSLEGFKLAAEAGLSWVEFDVQVTKDNQLVIMHDDTIDRTTNGSGAVHELNLEQLRAFSLTYHEKKTSNLIPTLAETLSLLEKDHVYANIELKLPEALPKNQVDLIRSRLLNAFVAYLESNWSQKAQSGEWPLVSSFDHLILIQLRERYPTLPLGFLVDKPTDKTIDLAKQHSPSTVHASFAFLTPEFMDSANRQNIPVLAYTVNSSEKAEELLRWGVYALFTDIGHILIQMKKK